MTAALVLQIVLQILTGIFLYFAVRKLTGMVAAVVSLAYWMLCPVLSGAVILGPEPLYQLLWMIGLCVCVEALDSFRGRGDTPGIRSVGGFFLSGIVIGILGYLDVAERRWKIYFWHGGKSFPREDSHGSPSMNSRQFIHMCLIRWPRSL